MNASPTPISPANAVQPSSSVGKQQDTSPSDVSFSQVLSSEIAQKNRGNDNKDGSSPAADAENTSTPAEPTGVAAAPALPPSVSDAPAHDLQPTAPSPATPETAFLGLGLHPDPFKLTQASQSESQPDQALSLDARTSSTLENRKGPSQQGLQAVQLDDHLAAMDKNQTIQTTQTDKLASTAAFSGQLAAARQTDAQKSGELLTDIMTQPGMRATPHVTLESAAPLGGVAANKLTPSVGTTAWGQALGEKIVWMAAGAQQTASLTLNPPNMGPLQIVLNISNEQATASFFSAQPEVRQALEAAFPRLREMMNEAGIQLGQATVSSETPQHHEAAERQSQRNATAFPGLDDNPTTDMPAAQMSIPRSGRGLIDTFA